MNTAIVPSRWRSLDEAAAWVRQQGVRNKAHWAELCKDPEWKPTDIPRDPAKAYGEGFKIMGGWGGFLSTGYIPHKDRAFVSLEEAASWVQKKGVKSRTDWWERQKADPNWRPSHIPSDPAVVYGEGFLAIGGWSGFLNKTPSSEKEPVQKMEENLIRQGFRSFESARDWVQAQKITSAQEFRARSQDKENWPHDMPAHPERSYAPRFLAEGGWGRFLGTGFVATQQRTLPTKATSSRRRSHP